MNVVEIDGNNLSIEESIAISQEKSKLNYQIMQLLKCKNRGMQ